MLWDVGTRCMDKILATEELKTIIESPLDDPKRPKFDAIITETYQMHEAIASGLAEKYSCPIINYQPIVTPPNVAYMIGNPHNPAYMSDYKMPFTSDMNFWQRWVGIRHKRFRFFKLMIFHRKETSDKNRFYAWASSNGSSGGVSTVLFPAAKG
uniref:Uncharacterized protein n=1 Tax=Cacopsylla melanoneura TaxID=428564 RepID=A0A8D8ZDI0_9HEMI